MANINQINELTQPMGGTVTGTQKTEKTDTFRDAMTQAFNQTGQTDKTESPVMETTEVAALGEIASTGLHIQDQSSIVSGKTDELLGLLEAYSRNLENPEVSLRNIAPILEQINQDADSLLKESVTLGPGNTTLQEIATQTVIAAQTEYEKFQRGDYLS